MEEGKVESSREAGIHLKVPAGELWLFSEFTFTQTRRSVYQCTGALVHAADSELTTLVNCCQLNLATSERIVFVRRAPPYSSSKEVERTLLQTQEV